MSLSSSALGNLKERLRVALTEKAIHSCHVGPMHGPMRDEPAILLSNAIDALCNVMEAPAETQEERADERILCDGCRVCAPFEHRCHGRLARVNDVRVGRSCECVDCENAGGQP